MSWREALSVNGENSRGWLGADSRDLFMNATRVLLVEDNGLEAAMLEESLAAFGYDVTWACNGREALACMRSGLYRLVISDWEMPEMSGLDLCRQIRRRCSGGYTYLILLTGRSGSDHVVAGLDAGADDYLTKPVQPLELCLRLRAAERLLALQSRELLIFSLAKVAESRDGETGAHLERVREYCRVLTEKLADHPRFGDVIDAEFAQTIYLTSPLHDIGKVGIPDHILHKPGRLTTEEFEVMKQHTLIGARTLTAALDAHPEADYLRMARDIALTHHEHFDGKGYPRGLVGYDIPLCGRIVAIVDVYDALTTARVYKPAFTPEVARSIILEGRGKHFDPDVVDAFLEAETRFLEILDEFSHAATEMQGIAS